MEERREKGEEGREKEQEGREKEEEVRKNQKIKPKFKKNRKAKKLRGTLQFTFLVHQNAPKYY